MTLAIIAGGAARRMSGAVKGLIEVEGRPIVARLLELVPACGLAGAMLVGDQLEPFRRFGLPEVPDRVPKQGAPGGVHAALCASPTPWVLAVAADMPFVTPEVVSRLFAAVEPGDELACFQVDGRLEPLLGVYRAGLATAWAEALGGPFSGFFQRFRGRVIAGDLHIRAAVRSINTPDDARAVQTETNKG